jgi:hypothetical protein
LIVDPDAVLAFAVAFQYFESIARRNTQVVDRLGTIEHAQLATRDRLNIGGQAPRSEASPDAFGFLVDEIPDHSRTITNVVMGSKYLLFAGSLDTDPCTSRRARAGSDGLHESWNETEWAAAAARCFARKLSVMADERGERQPPASSHFRL